MVEKKLKQKYVSILMEDFMTFVENNYITEDMINDYVKEYQDDYNLWKQEMNHSEFLKITNKKL